MKPTIYLCGGINGLSDSDATDWRQATKNILGGNFNYLDPMRRDYRGRELDPGIAEEIVDGDLEDIRESDFILAMADRPSWGTAMEIHFAASIGKPVIVVCSSSKPSPWLRHHATRVVPSLYGAWSVLRNSL